MNQRTLKWAVLGIGAILACWLLLPQNPVVLGWADSPVPTPTATQVTSPEWVNFYGMNSTMDGQPLPIGAVVEAWAGGVRCGSFVVHTVGWYGLLPCYRSYEGSPGANPGDVISFTVNGETTELNLTGFNSLESLKNTINNDVAGVNASIIYDGSDTGGYRLVLTSTEAGSDGAYTVDMSGLSGGTSPVMTSSQTAEDASLTVDGISVTATSNDPTDVISGLTLHLKDADVGTTVHVEVDMDTEGISDKVEAMVNAYNDMFTYINTQSGTDGTLRGNPTLNSVASRVENLFVSGLSGGLGDITNFFQVGITRGSDRQLEFNADDFADALSEDFGGVRDLFIERDGNLGKMYLLDSSIDDMTDSLDGLFKIATDSLNRKIDYADDTIDRYERSVESYQKTLERKFTAMEAMVSQLQAQGNYLAGLTTMSY